MIERREHDGVVVLKLAHGKASALDVELCEEIAAAFARERSASALVLTGSGSIFSAGVDLVRLVEGGEAYVRRFLPVLTSAIRAVLDCDRPVVAAINGHAIAGGCILAAACDLRFMERGRGRIGVPELLVGVPFPEAAREVMELVVPPARRREVFLYGDTWSADDALLRGLVDRVVEPEQLMDDSLSAARKMAAIDRGVFEMTKRRLLRDARERVANEEPSAVVSEWTSPAAMERIRSYVDANVRRKP